MPYYSSDINVENVDSGWFTAFKCEFPLVGVLFDFKWSIILSSFRQWCSSYRLANQFFSEWESGSQIFWICGSPNITAHHSVIVKMTTSQCQVIMTARKKSCRIISCKHNFFLFPTKAFVMVSNSLTLESWILSKAGSGVNKRIDLETQQRLFHKLHHWAASTCHPCFPYSVFLAFPTCPQCFW